MMVNYLLYDEATLAVRNLLVDFQCVAGQMPYKNDFYDGL
jgi:hypothetical protein